MHRVLITIVLCLGLTGTIFAKKCCHCCVECCETPLVSILPSTTLTPTESAPGCDDVRQAPTCCGIKPGLCRTRVANGAESPESPGSQRSEILRQVPEIWEQAWAAELPDLAAPFRTPDGLIR